MLENLLRSWKFPFTEKWKLRFFTSPRNVPATPTGLGVISRTSKNHLKRYMSEWMFIFGLRAGKFIIHMFTPGVLKRIPPFPFQGIHHPAERWCEFWQVLLRFFGSVQPWKFCHVSDTSQASRSEEIICKNRFNFKFIFRSEPSSPCVLYWFWYYRYHSSNDDVFSSSLLPQFFFRFVCLEGKIFHIMERKNGKVMQNWWQKW